MSELKIGDIIVFTKEGLTPRYGYKGQTAIVEDLRNSGPKVRLLSPRAGQFNQFNNNAPVRFVPSRGRYKKI